VDPDPVEIRVLGCLVEKQRTTPDAYPLTLNSLRLACNQSTNRDPIVNYDEGQVRSALESLGRRRWTRMASWGGRAVKYRHLLGEALGISDAELALLTVLMLRGPQTPGELKGRSDRIHSFASLAEVEATLGALCERDLARRLERRPGQKEQRYEQLLGEAAVASPGTEAAPPAPQPEAAAGGLEERVARLEREVAALRAELGA
jgi:uncharacterized protein YceH (UPF0502 family)